MKTVPMAILILCAALAAQNSSSPQGTAPGTPPPGRQQHMMAMQQHMQEMKAQMAKMQSNVDQMKANAAKIKDPAVRQQADLDAQMWQMMLDHMKGMQQMMADHEDGIKHGGMHQRMHHPTAGGTPPPAAPPQ